MKSRLIKSNILRTGHRIPSVSAVNCTRATPLARIMLMAVLFSFLSLGNALATNTDFSMLKSFKTDGCSASPNGVPSASWAHCCVAHDIWYWLGGSKETRAHADQSLKACMTDVLEENGLELKWIPVLYEWAVQRGGTPGLVGIANPFPWRWGFGWSTNSVYTPLTVESGDSFTNAMNAIVENLPNMSDQLKLNSEQLAYIQEKVLEVYFYHFANSYIEKSASP